MSDPRERAEHDTVVTEVARLRLSFPNESNSKWRTFTNGSDQTMGIRSGSQRIYPDIVVLDENNAIQRIGEVETASSINETEAMRWKTYSETCGGNFYLYVPRESIEDASSLLRQKDVRYSDLNAYSFVNGEVLFE